MSNFNKTGQQLLRTVTESVAEVDRLLTRPHLTPEAVRVLAAQLSQANNAAQRLQGLADEQEMK